MHYHLFMVMTHMNWNITIQCAGYIGEFELVDDHRAGKIVVELNGRLNKCGVISPRYDVGVGELEAWTARLLPSRQVFVFSFHSFLYTLACGMFSFSNYWLDKSPLVYESIRDIVCSWSYFYVYSLSSFFLLYNFFFSSVISGSETWCKFIGT